MEKIIKSKPKKIRKGKGKGDILIVDPSKKHNVNLDGISLQVCWILDITGSMSSEIAACKEAASKTAAKIKEDELPVSFTMITYTEDSSNSYATYDSFSEADKAVEFINGITLCKPPGTQGVNASGGDGDENVKLAIARLVEKHNFDVPTVCFFLTDANYHAHGRTKSSEAIAEDKALKEMGYPLDIFDIWDAVPKSQIFMFPMVFNSPIHTYGQFAKQTGGLLTQANNRSSTTISAAMIKIVGNIIDLLTGEQMEPINEIPGFKVYDTSSIVAREKETDKEVGDIVQISSSDIANILKTTMNKIVDVVGKGWTKRKINLNPTALYYQMKLVAVSLKYFTTGGVEEELKNCLDKIKEYTPEDQEEYITLTYEGIEELKSMIELTEVEDESKDLITLLSAKEVIEEFSLDEIKKDFIASVCSALYGLPINIIFRKDRYGNPDFTSEWNGVIAGVGIDSQSLKSFLDLVKYHDGKKQKGMTDGKDYNSFLILSGKPGSIRWAIFKIASALQVLDSAMSLSVGAPIVETLPELHAGILGTAFMRIIKLGYTESIFSRGVEILNTIEALNKIPAKPLQEHFEKGYANPADPIGKMVVVWYKTGKDEAVLLKVLKELMSAKVQRRFGKIIPETEKKYWEKLNHIFKFEGSFEDFGELNELHPLEIEDISAKKISKYMKGELEDEDGIFKPIIEKLQSILNSEQVRDKILHEDPLFDSFRIEANRIWTYLHHDINSDDKLPELDDIVGFYPNAILDYIETLFLRKRSKRYDTVKLEGKRGHTHVPKDPPCFESILFGKFLEFNKKIIKERKSQRRSYFRNKLEENIDLAIAENPERTEVEWKEFLAGNEIDFNGKHYALSRKDLASLEKFYTPGNVTFVSAMIASDWTSSSSQTLKEIGAQVEVNLKELENPGKATELMATIDGIKLAMRAVPNRHGYSKDFKFPGAYGLTEEYIERGGASETKIENMKKFTQIYQEFISNQDMNWAVVKKVANNFYYSAEHWPIFEKVVKAFHYKLFEGEKFVVEQGPCEGKHVWNIKKGKYKEWALTDVGMTKEDIKNVKRASMN